MVRGENLVEREKAADDGRDPPLPYEDVVEHRPGHSGVLPGSARRTRGEGAGDVPRRLAKVVHRGLGRAGGGRGGGRGRGGRGVVGGGGVGGGSDGAQGGPAWRLKRSLE